MTLNPSTMRLGIASILVGLVGAYGVRVMMEEDEVAAVTDDPEVFNVPVASADLPAGRVLRKGDLGIIRMTHETMNEKGWDLNRVMMRVEQITDRELKRNVAAHQPILTSDVWLDGDYQRDEPRPGMRGVQIRVAEDRGGRSVNRGESVDVFFTSDPRPARDGKTAIPEKTIQVAEAVKILHIDFPKLSEIQWAVGYKAKSPIFTLEVEPNDAAKITTLRDYGSFAVMARSDGEPAGRSSADGDFSIATLLGIEEPVPPQQPPVLSVEYWYGRQRRMKYFPVPQTPPAPTMSDQLAHQPAPKPKDVLPDAPAPRSQGSQSRPQIPYRPDPISSTPSPAPPRVNPPRPTTLGPAATPNAANSNSDPFTDDGEVLP